MATSKFDAIIFDLDETLIERTAVFLKVARDFYNQHLSDLTSQAREEVVALMVGWDGGGYTDRKWMRSQWLQQWPDTGLDMQSLEMWYRDAMVRNIQPDPEIIDFLTRLNHQRIPWGIVTNGAPSQRDKCKAAGLAKIAPFIIVSGEVGYLKPDARIFRDALSATGLTSPERIIFVGDNPFADIDGAKRLGMKAAWISLGREYPTGLTPPDYTIDHVLDVRNLV